ncbi:2-oxoglutarate synthase subunit KorB [Pseudodesulfovibrio profundus]|uniref:2-oxoglutarate synthase subunit KorB n=1 Tax=Pseudodesulfovibrio profundus TaxID=57320 RepID=A0A2C8F5W6_9BACT|nr:2-oxoacid:ferredoxin oxidoreductase subunit beta [Pseudodesulfovibrio profundus]MBC18602.1 2-oxoacid:ferredoxin oxidoreductase subunit beta [Desulfovibrio sp.]SOB57954.1 2-oxoglutarate synthase subunit KorB [Pseudodesulfovibrio profundus]|tara:strand:+ start:286 stop:1137 length:852 start_codon:yes stop_codon:yes gene_type:complete
MNEFTGNEIIHQYLRHNKKFPHVLCAGCGHGIVLGTLIRSIHSLQIPKDDVVIVAGIGCSGRLAVYVDFNTVHTTHGRALTFATGIKMANPKLNVITIMGDGDALSIGGNHLIHAARRNIGVTALILNNNIYGMTGGQSSPATPAGATTMTNPYGQLDKSFDTVELAKGAGANYVARGTVFHVKKLENVLTKAIERPGFSVVEAITPCHTQYGRKNKYRTPVDMYKWMKKAAVPIDRYNELPEEKREGRLPIGVFVERDKTGFEEKYYALQKSFSEKGKKGAK